MAELTQKQYLDLTGLSLYDGNIKAHIKAKDDALTTSIGKVASDLVDEAATARAAELAINNKIGTVAEGKTVVGMIADAQTAATYDDTQVKNDIKANADAIDAIEADYLKAADKTELSKAISDEADRAKAAEKANADAIGALDSLKTTAKNNAVAAINEVKDALDAAETSHKVDLTVAAEPTEGMLKTYVLSQGENELGKIDIPKDLVVTSGSIVENPDKDHQGTYIKLVIANQEAPLYINVKDLVDIYTAAAGATQVQLAVNGNEISATLVAGGVGTAELADAAVTTAKIADGNVTRAKISAEFEQQIAKLESAVGEGGNVDTRIAAAINALDSTATYVNDDDGLSLQVAIVDGKLTSISGSIETGRFDSHGSANAALVDAKEYTDTELAKVYAAIQPIPRGSIMGLFVD